MTGDDIARILGAPELARVREPLAALVRPSIRIQPSLVDEAQLPLGASKLGGSPDLPPELDWPTAALAPHAHMAPGAAKSPDGDVLPADGRIALPFVGQLALEELAPYDQQGLLPRSGVLYLFYNHIFYQGVPYGTPDSWRALYQAGERARLERRAPPLPIPPHALYQPCALRFEAELTLPHVETCFIGEEPETATALVLTAEEWEAYADLLYELRANRRIHQLLGHSDDLQPYAMESGYTSVREHYWPELTDWSRLDEAGRQRELEQGRLLLQVDEPGNGMRFGRDGRLFFFIREVDLSARRFEHVWATEQ